MALNNESRKLIIIFSIALSLGLILFFAVGSWNDEVLKERLLNHDSKEYHNIAVNLIENKVFSNTESSPHSPNIFRTPIYPFFLASVYAIFGYKPYIAIFFQLIIGAITCILTYKIGRSFFDKKIASFAGLFMVFEYSSILYNNVLMTETLFTFLFITHIYLLIKFIKENNSKMLVYSSVFLGLSTLCKPISIYFFIFLIPAFFLHFRKNLQKGILKYSILTLVFVLTITPWMVRNHKVSGKFLFSSAQEKVLRWHLYHLIKSRQKLKEVKPKQMERVQSPNRDPSTKRNVIHEISTKKKNNSVVLTDAKRYLKGMTYFIMATKEKKFLEFVLFISIITYFVIATGPVGGTGAGRYRVPVMPYIILLASYGMIQIQGRWRGYKLIS